MIVDLTALEEIGVEQVGRILKSRTRKFSGNVTYHFNNGELMKTDVFVVKQRRTVKSRIPEPQGK